MTIDLISHILAATPGWADQAEAAGLDQTSVSQILEETGRLAAARMAPLAARADAEGCQQREGRVQTPDGYAAMYRQLGEDGWIAADLDPDLGGMGLPLALHIAASLPMEGAALPFMMSLGASRAAAHCLAATDPELAKQWCPNLASGQWTATICISEPDAGSDVGRIRTKATETDQGWRIDGTKCWISFGDHDMAERIGHLCLARTGPAQEGTRGLSLFLVPNLLDGGAPNGVTVERIEEKLGLHGSPTCVLRFEGAQARMIGTPGRGLPQLFRMIELMRLQTGTQGAGIALDCATLARDYAKDRRQGGRPDAPPVPLVTHPDVQRQLERLDARAVLLVGLVLQAAVTLDRARSGDPEASALAALLLPLAKTFGGELGQASASDAIQLLGGAGYTREWRAERHFRDARIITIYEGTTGMQAQDFLLRRLLGCGDATLQAFLALGDQGPLTQRFVGLLERLRPAAPEVRLWAADAMLRAGWAVLSAGLCARLHGIDADIDRGLQRYAAALPSRLIEAEAEVDLAFERAWQPD